MLVLMQCVAEAVMANGLRGLADLVPGGTFLYNVAGDALRRLKDRQRTDQFRQEVLSAAAASFEEAKQIAEGVAREVAANGPVEDRLALEMFLTQIPGTVRQSLKRTEDPSGKSVPAGFALNEPADLMRQLPSRMPRFRPGDSLPGKPGWQIVELLGTGGFGEVWLARNPALSALKGAVKFGLDPQARDRLLRHEGALVNRVMEQGKHPNVVQLLDAHLEGDAPWLMYEYVPGGDLTGLILGWQQLPPADRTARATAALRTLASAVGHFHQLSPPLVHRDLKPANILVGDRRQETGDSKAKPPGGSSLSPDSRLLSPDLKVADFGIGGAAAAAALAQEASRRSSTGVLMSQLWGSHTPLYASPQQQRGEPPDPRDDVHALGVIAFQMMTGKLDATLGADYAKTLRRLNVSEPLIELLGDCAAHDPENRPKDAAELAERLQIAAGLPAVGASPAASGAGTLLTACPGCQSQLKIPKGETRPVKCGKCGITFRPFIAAPASPATSVSPEPTRARPTARPAKPQAAAEPRREPEPERDDDEDDRPRRRRREPERRESGFVRQAKVSGKRTGLRLAILVGIPLVAGVFVLVIYGMKQLFTGGGPFQRPGAAKVEKALTFPTSAGLKDFTFSPDGRRVLTVTEDGTAQLWDAETGAAGTKFTALANVPPVFNRDGTRLAVAGPERALALYDTTGTQKEELPGLPIPASALAFSIDGRAVAAGTEGGEVVAWEGAAKFGKPAPLKVEGNNPHKDRVTVVTFDPKGRYLASAGEDGTVKLWLVDGWQPHQSLSAKFKVTALAWSPDGKWLLAGCKDGKVRMWTASDAKGEWDAEPKVAQTGQGSVTRVSMQAEARLKKLRAFTLDVAGVGCIWDVGSTGPHPPIEGQGWLNTGAWSPDGKFFASAGDDRTVSIWETFFMKPRVKALGHEAPIRAVAWSPDSKRLASADANGTVMIWKMPPEMQDGFDVVEVR